MENSIKQRQTIGAMGILLALCLVYLPTLTFQQAIYDGGRLLRTNAAIHGPFDLQKIVTTDYWGLSKGKSIGSYRPFVVLCLWAEYQLWGKQAWGYGIVQIFLMLGICLLLYAMAVALGASSMAAWWAALLFAVHPVHTDIVASLAGQADLWMAFFLLLGLWLHHQRRWWAWLLAVLCVVCGLCSKEFFIIFPGVVVCWDVLMLAQTPGARGWQGWRGWWRRLPWPMYGIYGVCLVGYVSVRLWLTGILVKFPYGFVDNPLVNEPLGICLLNVPMLFWRYLELLWMPTALSPDRSFHAVPVIRSLWSGYTALGMAAIAGFLWLGWRLRRHPSLFLLFFGAMAYLPLSNILTPSTSTMADRWLFLASIPFCVGVCWWAVALWQRHLRLQRVLLVVGVGVLLSLGLLTYDYSAHWRSYDRLFRYAAAHTPTNVKARFVYGRELARLGKLEAALREFHAAIKIKPDSDIVAMSLFETYRQLGRLKLAEKWVRRSAQLQGKGQATARMAWVGLLLQTKRHAEARRVHQSILRDFPQLRSKLSLPQSPHLQQRPHPQQRSHPQRPGQLLHPAPRPRRSLGPRQRPAPSSTPSR